MGDDDRPKRSWRDIDQARGRSAHRSDGRRNEPRPSASYNRYKSKLDGLFSPGGTELPEHLKAMLGPSDPDAIQRRDALKNLQAKPTDANLRAYLDCGEPLPGDPRLLMSLLDLEKAESIRTVLAALTDWVDQGGKLSKPLLKQRLAALKLRDDADAIAEQILELEALV